MELVELVSGEETMRALVLIVLMAAQTMGQDIPSMFGASYTLPSPVTAAPGQLVTIIMQWVDTGNMPVVRAPSGADLPTTLAGISLSYSQISSLPESLPAPILEVHTFCARIAPWNWRPFCEPLSAVTIQIPFEAQSGLPRRPPPETGPSAGELTVGGYSLSVLPVPDHVHVLTVCDAILHSDTLADINTTGQPCASIVTHADGSAVSAVNPARAGEALVIYAVGLGQTDPPSVTGKLVTEAAPAQTKFTLDFNFHPNALPSRPLPTGPRPLYAGTTPGYVGLYQVNFVVPLVPDGTPACVDTSTLPAGSNVVESNLTVSVGGTYSFDGARICVAAPNP